jgi:hypothetical protein
MDPLPFKGSARAPDRVLIVDRRIDDPVPGLGTHHQLMAIYSQNP